MAYSISWTSKTETSIEVQVYYDQAPDMDYFYLELDGNSYDTVENDNDQYYNGYHTFTGLSPGTSYTLGVTFVDMNLDPIGSDSTTTSTYESNSSPNTPTNLSPSDGNTTTDNTPTFYADVSDPDGDSVSLQVEISQYSDFSSTYDYATGSAVSSGSRASVTISLPDGTWYWRLRADDGTDYSGWTSGRKLIIEEPRPPYFEWDTAKVSGDPFDVTATEWNNLTNNCNDVRNYEGLSSYSFTTVASNDKFMADYFNEMVNAILDMNYSTAPPSIKSGMSSTQYEADKITADDLNLMRDSLNSV